MGGIGAAPLRAIALVSCWLPSTVDQIELVSQLCRVVKSTIGIFDFIGIPFRTTRDRLMADLASLGRRAAGKSITFNVTAFLVQRVSKYS